MSDGKNFLVSYHYSIDRTIGTDMLISISGDGSFGYHYPMPGHEVLDPEAIILSAASAARKKVAQKLSAINLTSAKEPEIFIEIKNMSPLD